MATFRDAFPDYPVEAFPAVPDLFEDASWHHAACPCLISDIYQLTIWVDYPDPAMREYGPSVLRFSVEPYEPTPEHEGIATDDWREVLAYLETRKADLEPWERLGYLSEAEYQDALGHVATWGTDLTPKRS